MKTTATITALAISSAVGLAACQSDSDTASYNLSKAAEQFEIDRRVVFYNGINGEYMLTIEGRCSIEDSKTQLEVTCKVAESEFKKHFLGLSDNVTYFAEQLQTADVSVYHHRIIWKPQAIIPDIDLNFDADDLVTDRH